MNEMVEEKKIVRPRLVTSTRFTLALLVSFALFVQYSQRVGLSMAIVCMVDKKKYSGEYVNQTATISSKYGSTIFCDKQFRWSEFQQQLLLGAYWFGYIFTLVPSKREKSNQIC